MKKKNFSDLTFKDAFMFAEVMEDTLLCSSLLSRVLDMDIQEVSLVTEKTLEYHPGYHGVRLDVLAVENGSRRRFNVEMQVQIEEDLPRRSRYYHAQMDMDVLLKGEGYEMLPDSYVIFICNYDPVGDGKYRYTCRTKCLETGQLLDDGRTTILLSTKGTDTEEISENLKNLLDYVGNPDLAENLKEDPFIISLNERVETIKRDRDAEGRFMLLEKMLHDAKKEGIEEGRNEGIEEGRNEGIKEGRNEGEKRVNLLYFRLSESGRENEFLKAVTDPEYQKKLFEEFGL